MSNGLTKVDSSAITMIDSHALGDLIKPMIRDIHLFDTYVAGTTHLKDQSVLEKILVGMSFLCSGRIIPLTRRQFLFLRAKNKSWDIFRRRIRRFSST